MSGITVSSLYLQVYRIFPLFPESSSTQSVASLRPLEPIKTKNKIKLLRLNLDRSMDAVTFFLTGKSRFR
jgi:hypothetical protein